jgi:heme-degrading monooxygenase HmoA
MFTRIVTITGAKHIDDGISYVRDTVAPLMHQQHGFRGLTASADRSRGVFAVLSLWETAADRDASESALAKARADAEKIVGGTLSVETFEETALQVAKPPSVGSALLVRRISMDPARIDENSEFFRSTVMPQITSQPGFRAVRQMINRETGDGMVGTIWDDRASMTAAAEAGEARREMAAAQGVSFGEQTQREIVFIDMP